jgi:hypothetical protein
VERRSARQRTYFLAKDDISLRRSHARIARSLTPSLRVPQLPPAALVPHLNPRSQSVDDRHETVNCEAFQFRIVDTREVGRRHAGASVCCAHAQSLTVQRLDDFRRQDRLELLEKFDRGDRGNQCQSPVGFGATRESVRCRTLDVNDTFWEPRKPGKYTIQIIRFDYPDKTAGQELEDLQIVKSNTIPWTVPPETLATPKRAGTDPTH